MRAGITPKNHIKENRIKIKEIQNNNKLNSVMKDKEYSKEPVKFKKFENVSPKISTGPKQKSSDKDTETTHKKNFIALNARSVSSTPLVFLFFKDRDLKVNP
jgi:hypothetical protein